MSEASTRPAPPERQPQTPTAFEGAGVQPLSMEVFWQRRLSVAGMVVLCLGAAALHLAIVTPMYRSTSRLYVEREVPGVLTDVVAPTALSKNYLYTQAEVLKSEPVLTGTLERIPVTSMETFKEAQNVPERLKGILDVSVGAKDEILSVSCVSPVPQEAADIVAAVVDSYVVYNTRKKQTSSGQLLEILEKEKTTRDAELRQILLNIVAFKRENRIVGAEDGQESLIVRRLTQTWNVLAVAQTEVIEAKVFYDALVEARDNTELIRQLVRTASPERRYFATTREFVSAEIFADARRQLYTSLRKAEDELLTVKKAYREDSERARVAQEVVDRIEEQMAALEEDRDTDSKGEDSEFVEAVIAAANTRYMTALQKQNELERLADEQRVLAEDATIKQAEFAVLDADRNRTERLCDVLDTRIKELSVSENTGALNINILEFAKVADRPYRPRRTLSMALALIAGLALGAGLALLRDRLDVRLRTSEEVAAALGAPVLGVVPHLSSRRQRKGLARLVEFDPGSHAAEAFRTIRTAVYFGFPASQARTLVLTSPSAGDGKTTVASNLAIAMAQAGQRTLLLEADLRKPRHHQIYVLEPGPGLCGVLKGEATVADAVRRSGVERLDVLPCGQVPSNPSELLNSDAFAQAIRALSDLYDRIIIDAPPLGPVADARIVSALADATILILRAGRSTRTGAEQAREGLLGVGGTIMGAVVNDVQRGNRGYHEYGYGDRYQYYGYRTEEGDGRGASRAGARAVADDRSPPFE